MILYCRNNSLSELCNTKLLCPGLIIGGLWGLTASNGAARGSLGGVMGYEIKKCKGK